MKIEVIRSRFIISAPVSVLLPVITLGIAFASEVSGSFRPGNTLSEDNTTALVDLHLHATRSALTFNLNNGQLNTKFQLPCSSQPDGRLNHASKISTQYSNPCNSQISGYGYGDKSAFIKVASNELQGKICQASIQNQIEWNYKGNRQWATRNLEKICKNAEFSLQPGTCFHSVMHGSIDHGDGTHWKWQDALNLCAGTKNSTATINCFSEAIKRNLALARAIEQCHVKP